MTTTVDFDLKQYGKLLAKTLPRVIENAKENRRMLAIVDSLLDNGLEKLTPEEEELLKLLTDLIHEFESKAYPLPKSEPRKMLAFLMEQNELAQKDLAPILGARSRVSEILSGKRGISKDQARKLAAFFGVSTDVFLG